MITLSPESHIILRISLFSESAGEDEEEEAAEGMGSSLRRIPKDTETCIDMPKHDTAIATTCLLEKPMIDKKVKVTLL